MDWTRDWNKYKPYLLNYVTRIKCEAQGKHDETQEAWLFSCPLCKSGHGTTDDSDGAFAVYRKTGSWYCYSCKAGGDVYDLAMRLNPQFRFQSQAYAMLAEMFVDEEPLTEIQLQPKQEKQEKKTAPTPRKDYTASIDRWANAIWGHRRALEYLHRRGITDDTIRRFKLGYNYIYDASRIIFPFDPECTYYSTRAIFEEECIINATKKHYNCPTKNMPLFHGEHLLNRETGEIVFIVESPLCALSIMQESEYKAVATCGSHVKKIIECIEEHPTECVLALCFDNDDRGKEFTGDMLSPLQKLGVIGVDVSPVFYPSGDDHRKDPNEILQKDGSAALRAAIERAVNECRK